MIERLKRLSTRHKRHRAPLPMMPGEFGAFIHSEITRKAGEAAAPDFTLPDASGKPVRHSERLREGLVVLKFYRGGWCPYCNLELRAYQEALRGLARE